MRNGDYHWGTDIVETTPYRKDPRTPILAMDDGVVIEEQYNDGKDAYLVGLMIKHQGLNVDVRYLHMNPYVNQRYCEERSRCWISRSYCIG